MNKVAEAWAETIDEIREVQARQGDTVLQDNNLLSVCCDICGDDTGDTDRLTQALAAIVRDNLVLRMASDIKAKQHS